MKKILALVLALLLTAVCLAEGRTGFINQEAGVILREGPSADTKQVCCIPFTAQVEINGNDKNGFVEVVYNGQTGYVWGRYLTEEDVSEAEWKTVYVNAYVGLVMHASPNFESDTVVMMPFGAQLTLKKADDTFAKVAYEKDGVTYEGYVWSSFLSEEVPDEEAAKAYHEAAKEAASEETDDWDSWEDDGSLDDWEKAWT